MKPPLKSLFTLNKYQDQSIKKKKLNHPQCSPGRKILIVYNSQIRKQKYQHKVLGFNKKILNYHRSYYNFQSKAIFEMFSWIYYVKFYSYTLSSSQGHFWRRKWQRTPVFLPWESRGQRNLVGYSPWGRRLRHNWGDLASMQEHF